MEDMLQYVYMIDERRGCCRDMLMYQEEGQTPPSTQHRGTHDGIRDGTREKKMWLSDAIEFRFL